MTVSLIVAAAENNVIGKDNQLPWHLPADLKYFKNTTWAMPLIMGRKTFESMGKPLPGRKNIVLSRTATNYPGTTSVNDFKEAMAAASATGAKEVFIAGGGEIFRSAMSFADKIYLTRIHAEIEGDIYFPEFSESEWQLKESIRAVADDKNAYDMSFQIFARKK